MKKMISIILTIGCILSFVSCGNSQKRDGVTIEVFYINNAETGVETHDYELSGETVQEQLDEVLEVMETTPSKLQYKAPLAMVPILDYSLDYENLTLNMDVSYNDMSVTTEVLMRAALVCTLTQIEGISYVSITVDGNPLYDSQMNLVGMMSADQFVNNTGDEINSYEMTQLTLYFTDKTGEDLIKVTRNKVYSTNIPLERLVVDELIAGPSASLEGVYPTVNPDTKVISVSSQDGICYVNLDETFLNTIYNVTADVVIYSIVNSLVELSNINKVQISIDGDISGTYREKYSFSTIFERNLNLVTTLY